MIKLRINILQHRKLKDYDEKLKNYLMKENITIDDNDFFILLGHIETIDDIEIFKSYKFEKIGKIAILHDSFDYIYDILEVVDRVIVHHRFQKEILLSKYINSTYIIHLDYPIEYKRFINPPSDIKIFLPEECNDEEIIDYIKSNYEIVNDPQEASIFVLAYKDESFGNYHTFYELFSYQRPFILPKFPQFIEFSILKSTVDILYSNKEQIKKIVEKFKDKWFYRYHLSIVRAHAISNSFKRFSKQLMNVMKNVIPEDFVSLYI